MISTTFITLAIELVVFSSLLGLVHTAATKTPLRRHVDVKTVMTILFAAGIVIAGVTATIAISETLRHALSINR